MSNEVNTRSVILDILLDIYEKEHFTHVVLSDALKKYQYLDNVDRSFISRTVLGTVERTITLDYVLDKFSKVKTPKMKPVIRTILRMSAYQLIFMDSIKDFAVCNEAVKLANKRGFATLKGFVNGVLRTIAREKDNIEFNTPEVKYSTPKWIIDMWTKEYGKDVTEHMLAAQYVNRPLSIRVNLNKTDRDALADALKAQGIKTENTGIPEGLFIDDYDYLDKIKEFREGQFFVQDISSMLVSHVAAPKEGNYIIDVCAAPGGKSLHLAEMMKGTGLVDARDISDAKVKLINDNIERLGLTNVKAKVSDATVLIPEDKEKADIVIADLPCSGLGILNKKPDIKYHASADKCRELVKIQRDILDACNSYVKAGGILIYSTCTVNPLENRENARYILENLSFERIDIASRIPEEFHKYIDKDGNLLVLPDENNNLDGFFIAGFVRK